MRYTMILNRVCDTCRFNWDNVCVEDGAFGHDGFIVDGFVKDCEYWEPTPNYLSTMIEDGPWYITEPYKRCIIDYPDFLDLIKRDQEGQPIQINIYDAIEKTYAIFQGELAEILKVPYGVIGYARTRGTIARRKVEFSEKLQIPEKYFEKFTSNDLPCLIQNKANFLRLYGSKLESIRIKADDEFNNLPKGCPPPPPLYLNRIIQGYLNNANVYGGDPRDYKSWDYVVEIRLKNKSSYGSIYYEFCLNKHYQEIDIKEEALDYLNSLSCEVIDYLNEVGTLISTINLRADENEKDAHFELMDDNHELDLIIAPAEKIADYFYEAHIIQCLGHGKKKEKRTCISCKHFPAIDGTARGYCPCKKQEVQRSRIICAFDYVSRES